MALLVIALLVAPASAALYDSLQAARFLHQGLINNTDDYRYIGVACGYLEPENITAAQSSWGQGGSCPYLFKYNESQPTACNAQPPHQGFDRPGGDYKNIAQAVDNVTLCEQTCCDDVMCMAWVYASSAPAPFLSCSTGDHCCYLKSVVPDEKAFPGLVNGVMDRPPVNASPPPLGMRSAVPLGGLGAGAVELRGDGTFHEWTIMNGSPAGAAKFGVIGDAWMAMRADPGAGQAATTGIVRTHPPAYAAGSGVSQIGYSGAYPMSRLSLNDPRLPLQSNVFAYSTLVPGDMQSSAYPAAVLTLAASNPSSTQAYTAQWTFVLPFGAINDCRRPSTNVSATVTVAGYAACLHECSATADCASWSYNVASGACALARDVPWSVHADGYYCGVQGGWSSDGASLNLAMHPPAGEGGPANGDVTLRPVVDGGNGPDGVTVSFGVADDPSAVWGAFQSSGAFSSGQNGITAAGTFENVTAGYGAVTVSAPVQPGGNITLSIVFAWYFPDRDHMGVDIGNYYSNLWDSSQAVASELADQSSLMSVVHNLNTHHAVFNNPDSTIPGWITDHMINQMSHFRGLIWTRDGRLREFEAFDCPDVDSIHNDYQRHLPYLWLLPEFELSKMRKWGSGQATDGHIWEYLGSFSLGPLDQPGGRTMGDTTTLWVMELLELWHNTGDEDFLLEMWPIAKRAVYWQIQEASQIGLPWHLVCTYDIIDFDQYNSTTFNSFLHMAMMKAAIVLAGHLGDNQTASDAQAALVRAQGAVQTWLWNSSMNYYRAYIGGDAIMADCLYGQMVAHHHGLGWLADQSQIGQHLTAELKFNGNEFGLTVVTGRHTAPPADGAVTRRQQQAASGMQYWSDRLGVDTQDDTVWEGGGPDWSYLALVMDPATSPTAGNITAALDPARRSMENWRSRLNDLWNIAGLSSTDDWGTDNANGQPWITSHYGFMLTDYYLVPALTGQQTNIPAGQLSFAPLYACPFNLPALLAGTTGTISCDATEQYTMALAFGSLQLPAGGLSVNGKACPVPVQLTAGQSISW